MNGKSDQISMLKQGSGFLALDRDEMEKLMMDMSFLELKTEMVF